MRIRLAEFIVASSLLLLSIGFFYYSSQLPTSPLAGPIGPGLLPELIAISLIIMNLGLIVQSLRPRPASTERNEMDGDAIVLTPRLLGMVVLGATILFFYLLALPTAGFLISTPIFSLAMMAAYGCRNVLAAVVISLLITGVVYGLFRHVFLVPLP